MKTSLGKIPFYWAWAKLNNIGQITAGGTPSSQKSEYYNGNIAWLTPADLTGYKKMFISRGKRNISELGLRKSSAKLLPKGSILFSSRAPIGYVVIAANEISTNQGFKNLIPSKEIFNQYIYYYLKFIKSLIVSVASGTTFKEISGRKFSEIPVPIPPLPEQHRIAAKIEELFSEIDQGIESLKKAQEQLKIYKKTVIHQAVIGDLTKLWRKKNSNLESSEILFKKIQLSIEKWYLESCKKAEQEGKKRPIDPRKNKKSKKIIGILPELPEKWNYKRLEDLSFKVTDGTHFTPKYIGEGVKFLSVKNVRPFKIIDENIKYISIQEHINLIRRCYPEKGDILYTKVGTYGYAAVNNLPYEFSIFVSLCLIKPVQELLISKYLELVMNSELVFRQARERVSGIGVPDLHLIEIRDFRIPLSSFEEQKQIILEFESRINLINKLDEVIISSLNKTESLKQSILKKAFEGKLVPQDPNDEPAEILLKRIKAEKEKVI